jgi:hypothetical protein
MFFRYRDADGVQWVITSPQPDMSVFALKNNAAAFASVVQPAATVSTAPVMMGMGATFKLTPVNGTRAHVTISGHFVAGTAVIGFAQIRYGVGTPPANGAAAAGAAIGQSVAALPDAANGYFPFSRTVIINGLTPGVSHWFDLSLNSNNGASVAVNNIDFAAYEF